MVTRKILIISIILNISVSYAESLLVPPISSENFILVKDKQIKQLITPKALEITSNIIIERGCNDKEISIYVHPTKKSKAIVLTLSPYCSLDMLHEFPLTIVVVGDQVKEINLTKFGFMYQSGKIEYITDIDRDDSPEIWISGPICECDGGPEDYGPQGCDCDGGVTVELLDGKVERWKNKKGWHLPW
jgi:hypothetical protein